MVVALICGELAAMLGLEMTAAFILWTVICVLAVAFCYGLFLVGKKVSGWNKLWISASIVSILVGYLSYVQQEEIYKKYDEIQYGDETIVSVGVQYGDETIVSSDIRYGNKYTELDVKYVDIQGTITNIQRKKYSNNLEVLTEEGIVYIAVENVENLIPGMYIMVTGTIETMETADNPGNYDEYKYLHSNGVILKLKAKQEDICIKDKDASVCIAETSSKNTDINIQGILYKFRCRIKGMLLKICTDREEGLLAAMVIGEKSDIDADVKELYSLQGIAHVLAISGLHISVIGMGIYKILRRKMWYMSSATISAAVMICFSFMTGNSVSAVRAVVMFVLHVIADVCGRKYDMLSALSLSAILLLWDNPYYITNASFLLSYAAMVAVSVTGPVVTEFVGSKNGFFNTVLFNISLTFTSMPINCCLFYRLSTYSILLNLLVVPLMSVVLLMTILGIIAGFVVESAGIFLIGTAVYILRLYEGLSSWTSSLPFSSVVTGSLEWNEIVLYYACLGLMILVMKYGRNTEMLKWSDKLEKLLMSMRFHKLRLRDKRNKTSHNAIVFDKYIKIAEVLGVIGLIWGMINIVYSPKQDDFQLCFLDVGQGDCAYIHSETGVDYLIDGGSTDERGVGQYKIEGFLEYMDVDVLEYVFVSHCDTDHISGIVELIERGMVGIDNLVLPITEKESMSENAANLISLAQAKGIQVMYFGTGDKLKDGDMELYCVSPEVKVNYEDINEASTVLLMKYQDINCVFTGDIGVDTEKRILEKVESYFSSESKDEMMILKASHHGSKGSSDERFIRSLSPDMAVISCGEDNSYGHPHREVLERLELVGSQVLVTSECGAVVISISDRVEVKYWKNDG